MVVSWRLCGCVHPISEAHCVLSLFRALADILRQQGPIPIAHCERETISAIDTSPKENTPVRSTSKNHYTPVRTAKQTPGKWELLTLTVYWFFFEVLVMFLLWLGWSWRAVAALDVLIDRTGFCKSLGTVFLWRLGMREIRSGTDENWWPICDFSSDWCDSLMWSRVWSSHGEVWLPTCPYDKKVWHCPGCQMCKNKGCILTQKLLSYWNPQESFLRTAMVSAF